MIITSTTAAGDLWRLSATELAAAIRHRQVSAGEVVDAHLRRIDAVNSADGLPQVVQVIGPRYREDLCLDGAAAIEDSLGAITPIDPR